MSVLGNRCAEERLVFSRCEVRRHRLPRRRKLKPVVCVYDTVAIGRSAAVGRLTKVNRNKLCPLACKQWRGRGKELPRNVLRRGNRFGQGWIVLVEEYVIIELVNDGASTFF